MTPAPATVSIPPRDFRKGPKQAPRATVEAPGASVTVTFLFGARIELRGVMGVSTDAVAQYVEMLQRDLAEQARSARLDAITLAPPASIDAALLDVVEGDEQHSAHQGWRRADGRPLSDTDVREIETYNRPGDFGYVRDDEHPADCTDPCCVPDEHESLFFRDEADAVLSNSAGYYGVSSGGAL